MERERERTWRKHKTNQGNHQLQQHHFLLLFVAICCYFLLDLSALHSRFWSEVRVPDGLGAGSTLLLTRPEGVEQWLGSSWFIMVPLCSIISIPVGNTNDTNVSATFYWFSILQADLKGDEGTIAIVLDGCCTPCLAWSWFIAVSFHPVNPNLHQLGNLIPGLWKTEVGHGCCWGGNIGVDRVWSSSCTGSLFDRSLCLKRELSDLAIGLTCLVRECTAGSGSLLRDLFVGLRRSCIIMASLLITAQAHQNQLDTLSTTLLSSLSSP